MLQEIDALIKNGKILDAKKLLKKQLGRPKKRDEKLQYAVVARRLGLPNLALKLLYKQIHDPNPATPLEKLEYSISLIRLGCLREGNEFLNQINPLKTSEAYFYKAFSEIYKWDYISAEQNLYKYIETKPPPYMLLVAETNLAACLVMNQHQFKNTENFIKRLLEKSLEQNSNRLRANCLELLAQLYVYNDKIDPAKKALNEASQLIDTDASIDGYFINKWQALIPLKVHPGSKDKINDVISFRNHANKEGYWEVVRDCDLHLGIWNRSRTILEHLIFGTPYIHYRLRVEKLAHKKIDVTKQYDWRLNQNKQPETYLNLNSGIVEGSSKNFHHLKKKQHLQLLRSLSSDFYRPIRISTISEHIFSDQYYDPFSTPNRVHQAVSRLKTELANLKMPLTIISSDGYLLKSSPGFGLRLGLDITKPLDPLSNMKQRFALSPFSASQMALTLQISVRKSQMLLKDYIAQNEIERVGSGRSTKYRFKISV